MRWTLLLVLILAIPLVLSSSEPWGCCVPNAGVCFDSSGYEDNAESTFKSTCASVGGNILDPGLVVSCSGYAECTIGCCCATNEVPGSPIINSTETGLQLTDYVCSLKGGDYEFKAKLVGESCVSICGGTPGPEAGGEYDVSGTVVNASDSSPLGGASVFIPIPGGQITATAAADGTFRLEDVPYMQNSVFATYTSCQTGQSNPILIDRDITDVEVSVPCGSDMCVHNNPTFQTYPESVQGTDEIVFTMSLADTCQDLMQYEPQRCDDQFNNCVPFAPSVSPAISDSGLLEGTTYCYKVSARFSDGDITSTSQDSQACITTGNSECLNQEDPTWCGSVNGESSIMSCDADNVLQSFGCGTLVCANRPDPQCVDAPPCDKCNGLLGFFAHIGFQFSPDNVTLEDCQDMCLLDSTIAGKDVMVDAYTSCLGVNSCSGYNGETACGNNDCNLLETCSWLSLNEELGQGVCVSESESACGSCNDLGGLCNKNTCEALGSDCYFDGDKNGLAFKLGCLSSDEMACRYYDTQADCSGGATWDITWNNDFTTRTGDTNTQIATSADKLSIGACSWNGQFCLKNADMKNPQKEDCIDNKHVYNDVNCFVDSTPPVTEFFLGNPPSYGQLAVRTLPYIVTDDRSQQSQIKTYVCLHQGEGCYPTETLAGLNLPGAGAYTLNYFSLDASENSEVVNSTDITITTSTNPGILGVTIEEDT